MTSNTNRIEILNQLTVLFADDDAILRETIGDTLSMFFNQVLIAEDGQQAFDIFQQQTVHVVILDISMPEINGLALAQKIRELDPDIPIIIMTSYKEENQLLAAVKLRLVDYLVKPVNFQNLNISLQQSAEQVIRSGRLMQTFQNGSEYHLLSNTVKTSDGEFQLTKNERIFLDLLLKRRGQLIEIDEITLHMGDGEYTAAGLRNLVYRLRKKLGKDAIVSVKDLGYLTP